MEERAFRPALRANPFYAALRLPLLHVVLV
jgi:hypothetical protein